MRNLLLTLLSIPLFVLGASAQTGFGCIDTLLIQAGPPCYYGDYTPVCGCDGATYRNGCYSYYNGVTSTVDGPCELVDFDFKPNPVAYDLFLTIVTQYEETPVNIYIYDLNGNLYYYDNYQTYAGIKRQEVILDVSYWERGIYMIMAQVGDYFTLKKFVKHTIE